MSATIGSLCTGYGGLDMGISAAYDAETIWTSDIDAGANKIIQHHYPHAPNLGDMTTINWEDVPPVDILCGGTPCQDLSMAGRRAGMKPGTRSGLWESMFTAIKTLHPRLVVWENVQGAYSAPAFSLMEPSEGRLGEPANVPALRALGRVLGDLASIGYDAQWHGLRASDVGAPHPRFRVFLAAYPQGERWWLNQREPEALEWATVTGEIKTLPTPRASDAKRNGNEKPGSYGYPHLPHIVNLLPTPKASDGTYGLSITTGRPPEKSTALTTCIKYTDFGEYAPAIRRWEHATGRPAPQPTRPNKNGTPQLSAEFVEWMMGLPQGHVTSPEIGLTRTQQLHALGNGVVPQQATTALYIMAARERKMP